MKKLYCLTRRNCLVFLRDHSAVFFSLLSMFIVLLLMGVFLGDMNVENVTDILAQYGGVRDAAIDKENASHLVQYWTLAGILVVNAITVTLTVLGVMVTDVSQNRMESFYTAPVNKLFIAVSYILSAIVIGTVFCLITFAVAVGYICATGGAMLSIGAIGRVILYIVMNVSVFAVILYLVALFIKSSSAWSGLATITGTLVGFVGAIYLPMGSLPEGVANVLKYIPILHGTALMRSVCCSDALQTAFAGAPEEMFTIYQEHMGITVVMQDKIVSSGFQVSFLLICGMIALGVTAILLKSKNISDR